MRYTYIVLRILNLAMLTVKMEVENWYKLWAITIVAGENIYITGSSTCDAFNKTTERIAQP